MILFHDFYSFDALYQTFLNISFYTYTVPRSTNLIDAGMYVCRYAYSIYLLRNTRITYENAGATDYPPYFLNLITNSNEFNFDSEDIKNMGKDMKTLIGRLSAVQLDD